MRVAFRREGGKILEKRRKRLVELSTLKVVITFLRPVPNIVVVIPTRMTDVQITGTPEVQIQLSSTHDDGAIFVYLEDVDDEDAVLLIEYDDTQ